MKIAAISAQVHATLNNRSVGIFHAARLIKAHSMEDARTKAYVFAEVLLAQLIIRHSLDGACEFTKTTHVFTDQGMQFNECITHDGTGYELACRALNASTYTDPV